MRRDQHISLVALGQKAQVHHSTILYTEHGKISYHLSGILHALGYELHHPIAQYVLKQAREEKQPAHGKRRNEEYNK